MTALIQVSAARIDAPGGRVLFDGLDLALSREHVALVGRNGVGKSTLLAVLAGEAEADGGRVVARSKPCFVPQELPRAARSSGEERRRLLREAKHSGADVLLLDEPTEDLDEAGVAWLRSWLAAWQGCLVVASHDRRLLADFRHFFVASESGCRYFAGTLAELDAELERERDDGERRYAHNLHRLVALEEHTLYVARRKARKKRYGRCSELDRATPRVQLNKKRHDAQVSHGRIAKLREAKLASMRAWSKSTRRALGVRMSLELPLPVLPSETHTPAVTLAGASARAPDGGRWLFEGLDVTLSRERVAVLGPNGAGKTTLLDVMLGRRAPDAGTARRELSRIGAVAQGGSDWMRDESLAELLELGAPSRSPDDIARILVVHKFPLALGDRPLRTLSPGERARAALIALYRREPAVELLVLDEPTYGLDLVGQRAMTEALAAWPGGLVVTSHDRELIARLSVTMVIELGR